MVGITRSHFVYGASISLFTLFLMANVLAMGCAGGGSQSARLDQFGRTYYLDGAGNWGFGVAEVQLGLRRAGYRGSIINYRWSPTLNPVLDQTIGRPIARLKGAELGKRITLYLRQYPDNQVSIIALSAGTGVAVWACENLQQPAKVHNLILLSSSLSSTYDMSRALENIEGNVWVYHSRKDMILQGAVRALGTIDGKLGVDSAGLVGLRDMNAGFGKIRNIGWSSGFQHYGWSGGHTDSTSEPFVRAVLARHVIPEPVVVAAKDSQAAETTDDWITENILLVNDDIYFSLLQPPLLLVEYD